MKQISLSIPTPCHENWAAMTPEDKGRFCGACQKTVVDFTNMSDREVAQFFKKPAGSVCGRFDGSQLNRVVEVPRKRLPWVKYFFGVALPAMLFSKKAAAQGEVQQTLGKVAVCNKPLNGTVAAAKPENLKVDTVKLENVVFGRVFTKIKTQTLKTFTNGIHNDKGKPIPFASIMAKAEGRAVVANSAGIFSIKYVTLPLTLETSSIGYQTQTFLYNGEINPLFNLKLASYYYETLGIVIVASVRKKKTEGGAAVTKKTEVLLPKLSVYPNPVSANSSFSIDTKTLESGNYTMQILNISGELIQTKELALEAKDKHYIALGAISTGSYFVRLIDRKDNKSYTEKIIVQ